MTIALAIAGIACILYGVTVMMVWSGTWFFAVWYVIGAALLALAWAIHSGWWEQIPLAGRRVIEICACIVLAVVVVCGGAALSGFGQKGEDNLDHLIVLGAQVYEDRPSAVLQYRLDAAADYLAANENTKCIVSGGQGFNEPRAEADVMGEYLEARGIDPSRIVREGASLNTVDNIENSMRLLPSSDAHVGIVTNDFHVFRGVGIARKAGLTNA